MSGSTSHFDQRITRSRLVSWWSAGNAVHDNIPQEAYLIYRLRDYEARYRHSHYPLPFEVVIVQGHLKRVTNTSYLPAWDQIRNDPTDEETGERFQSQSEIEEITRDQQELDEEDAWLRNNLLTIREKQEALQDEAVDAIGTGRLPGPTTMSRLESCRRRPRLPFPWMPVLGYTAIATMTMVESYQMALPILDSVGVDTTRLAREWTMNPLGVLGGAGFALAASVGLFFLWYLILRSAGALSRSVDSAAPGLIVRQGAGIFFLCCVLLVGTCVIANLRHGMTNDVTEFMGAQQGMGHSVFLFLTLLVPFASAYVHHRIGQSACWQRRREIIAAQQQWEREEEERLVPAETLADRMHLIQQRRAWIEQQRTQLRNKRSGLVKRAQAAQQQRRARLEQARSSTAAYARTLIAALEQDRYYFHRAAQRSKALHLVPAEARGQSLAHPQPRHFVRALLSAARNGHVS